LHGISLSPSIALLHRQSIKAGGTRVKEKNQAAFGLDIPTPRLDFYEKKWINTFPYGEAVRLLARIVSILLDQV
jgi:hypothetical protein